MTTSVRIVNLGPGTVRVKTVNPKTGETETGAQLLVPQAEATLSVYDTQSLLVAEDGHE